MIRTVIILVYYINFYPTTKPVTDFHRQDVTHAGRTKKQPYPLIQDKAAFIKFME